MCRSREARILREADGGDMDGVFVGEGDLVVERHPVGEVDRGHRPLQSVSQETGQVEERLVVVAPAVALGEPLDGPHGVAWIPDPPGVFR